MLAVAAASPDEESKLLSGGEAVRSHELRVADTAVGELRWRPIGEAEPGASLLGMVTTLLGLELERSRSPEWASEEAASDFVRSLLGREVTDRGDIAARAAELGADFSDGAGVLIARAHPRAAQSGDWRSRALTLALRAVRAVSNGALAAEGDHPGEGAEIVAIVPATEDERLGEGRSGAGRRAGAGAERVRGDGLPQPPRRRSRLTSIAPARRRAWPPTSARPRAWRSSPSRTPAPTACCCRR